LLRMGDVGYISTTDRTPDPAEHGFVHDPRASLTRDRLGALCAMMSVCLHSLAQAPSIRAAGPPGDDLGILSRRQYRVGSSDARGCLQNHARTNTGVPKQCAAISWSVIKPRRTRTKTERIDGVQRDGRIFFQTDWRWRREVGRFFDAAKRGGRQRYARY